MFLCDAVGTMVEIVQGTGPVKQGQGQEPLKKSRQRRWVHARNGFSAQSDQRVLFALPEDPLGDHVEAAGEVSGIIDWCGRGTTTQRTLRANRYHTVRQSIGERLP